MSLAWLIAVTVFITRTLAEIETEFTKWPESVIAPVGDTVSFDCAVNVPGGKLGWRWKSSEAPDEGEWRDMPETENETVTSKLTITIREDTPAAFYQCVVWYGAVVLASTPARLTIAQIDLSANSPEKRIIQAPLRNTVVLHCKPPKSEPPAVLNWWKEDKGSKTKLDTPHGVLILKNVNVEHSGTYGCTATNELSDQVIDLPEKTYLKVQHESRSDPRFLEDETYVGIMDNEGVLTKEIRGNTALRLWCGGVASPPPVITWSRENGRLPTRAKLDGQQLTIPSFRYEDEGIYSCSVEGIRRAWKVVVLQGAEWEGGASSVNASEGQSARVACGRPHGYPTPRVHWLLNAKPVHAARGVVTTDSVLQLERVEKRHAGIVQCFACNEIGCSYDSALLTVVPQQISEEYPVEGMKALHHTEQPPKRHNRKNPRKNKAIMVPPSRPSVTRMSDDSVMVTWSNGNYGLPIQFFKVQYREVFNNSNGPWQTSNQDIPPHIHSSLVDGLIPDRYYRAGHSLGITSKYIHLNVEDFVFRWVPWGRQRFPGAVRFRIAAVYSNQDNKSGKSSGKFYLQRGGFRSPQAPVLTKTVAVSPTQIMLNWTWSSGGGVQCEGFYVYYRAVSSAGEYEKTTAPANARSTLLLHLMPDVAYEFKVQAYTAQAPSDFSTILTAKTLRPVSRVVSTTLPPPTEETKRAPGALVTAGSALGAAALLLAGAITLLLCRRARSPPDNKEKSSRADSAPANNYIPAKVPITITANPMHSESGDSSVEMSYLHNNNCGNNGGGDETMSRKNAPTRNYV